MTDRRGLRLFGYTLHKEQAGVISEAPVWVLQYGCWIHVHESLFSTLREAITEHKHDRHLAF